MRLVDRHVQGDDGLDMAGFDRRQDDWQYQADLAAQGAEAQIDKQIVAADLRRRSRSRSSTNHELQIEQPQAIEARSCATSTRTASCTTMVSQLSRPYFQTYQLAYDTGQAAPSARYQLRAGRPERDVRPVRLLGQPAQGAAGRRAAVLRPQADGAGVPRPEQARVRADEARVAGSARPVGADAAAHDRRVLRRAARGAVRPRLPGPLHAPDQDGQR